jgi:hypothetical protein
MDNNNCNGSLNEIQKVYKNHVLTLHDHFYRKMYIDNLKYAKKNRENRGKQSKKYLSYHGKLLNKIVDRSGLTRGKMTEFTEYNAYNSDYSDDDMESNDLPLIYQFGFASIYANSANYKDMSNIPKETRKAKHSLKYSQYILQKNSNNTNNTMNNDDKLLNSNKHAEININNNHNLTYKQNDNQDW